MTSSDADASTFVGRRQTDEPRFRFLARLEPDLHAGLSAAADELDWSTNTALNEAVRDWLRRRQGNESRVDRPDGPNVVDLQPRPGGHAGAYDVIVDGFPVPHLIAYKVEPEPGWTSTDAFGLAVLSLDDRCQSRPMPWGQFWPTAWFIANAMAVAAGYSSHGPNATRINPHGPNEETDFRAWAENGWRLEDGMGRGGKGYELSLAFALPHLDGGDLRCYALRDDVVGLLAEAGARAVSTRLVALGPMQAEPGAESS